MATWYEQRGEGDPLVGFVEVKRYEPDGRFDSPGWRPPSAAKVMLARVDEVPAWHPGESSPGFLYLYTRDIEAFRRQLLRRGIEPGEIEDGPGPGPSRQLCVRDPDGHGHMVAELFEGSVGSAPPR